MIELTLRHPLNCTPEHHWALFFDPEWTRTLIIDGLGFASCEVAPVREEGDERRRDMSVTPKLDVPAAVAKLLGPRLGYTEKGRFHIPTKTWTYDLVLNVLTEKIRMGGTVTVEPLGDERCTRVSKIWCEVKIFGLGGMVEKAAEKNMRDGWNRSAEWINGWLAEHPEPSKAETSDAASGHAPSGHAPSGHAPSDDAPSGHAPSGHAADDDTASGDA